MSERTQFDHTFAGELPAASNAMSVSTEFNAATDYPQFLPPAVAQDLKDQIAEVLLLAQARGFSADAMAAAAVTFIAPELTGLERQLDQAGAALAVLVSEFNQVAELARRRAAVGHRLREELAAARVDAERFRALAAGSCPQGLHAGWRVASEHLYVCPCLLGDLVDAGELDEATRVADLNDIDQNAPTEDEIAAMEYVAECADHEPMSAYDMDPDIEDDADVDGAR